MYDEDKITHRIAKKVINRRIEKGYTQKDLRDNCNVSIGTIRNVENPKENRYPSIYALQEIADGLDCKLEIKFKDKEVG